LRRSIIGYEQKITQGRVVRTGSAQRYGKFLPRAV
jgi:hypothetical protein